MYIDKSTNKMLIPLQLSKSSKGKPAKKSIFATSEHVKGKVGVGTCGISGKPMTGQSNVPKYHKGM